MARWCRSGDVEALGALFDLNAPGLLKLAIHLVGDPAEAEDLVQATFLAAIEQRKRIDPSQPAKPWLVAVLQHKAIDARRRAARSLDPEVLVRVEDDASRPAERRELSGVLAKTIDRLEEPYRQIVLLRLRHGLAAADIAHVLGSNPGTVRVQLHRAHEKLRRLLPASMASAFAFAHPRGLKAVKSVVLEEANLVGAALTSTSWIGAWIMGQKIAIAAAGAIALVVAAAWYARTRGPAETEPEVSAIGKAAEPEPDGFPVERGLLATGTHGVSDPTRVRLGQVGTPDSGEVVVSGSVFDAETNEPVAGALVQLFAPRELSLLEAVRANPELFEIRMNGVPHPRLGADWPHLSGLSAVARFGREPVGVYGESKPGTLPIAESTTGANGAFSLPCSEEGGLLVCEHPDYGRRCRAAHDPSLEWNVGLLKERVFSGRLLHARNEPLPHPLTLVLTARGDRLETPVGARSGSGVVAAARTEALGSWTTTTDEADSFRVAVAADEVSFEILDPGWRERLSGVYDVGTPALIIVEPVPILHFSNASTGAPIERVHLVGRELRNGYVRWSGEFDAPEGKLTLPGSSVLHSLSRSTLAFSAWAEGYAEASFVIGKIEEVGIIEVPLSRGEPSEVAGVVRRGNRACNGAEVALLGHSHLQWTESEDTLVDAVHADEAGRFRLCAGKGKYVVRVIEGETTYFELVVLPAEALLDIDLDATGRIEVEIVDTQGAPRGDHVLALSGEDGRSLRRNTDGAGRACFPNLSPAVFKILVPHVTTEGSFGADELVEVSLERGEVRHVRVEIPALTGPRHVRVVCGEVSDYGAWRARYTYRIEWVALHHDGTVPLDLATDAFALEIAAPDERRWSLPIPKEAPDGHVIQLLGGEGSYRGLLLDGKDAPIAGARVFALPREGDLDARVRASCVTDAQGGFELLGLSPCVHSLVFRADPEKGHGDDFRCVFKGMSYVPAEPASGDAWLEIRLARAKGKVRMYGTVRKEADRSPMPGALVSFTCTLASETGTMQLGSDASTCLTDGDGRFEVSLPRTPERWVRVFGADRKGGALVTLDMEDAGLEEEVGIEILVP